ncbi:MAG: hypothetical protein JW786_01525 [Desulfobacterales bacterium]|nr:hypothetical protein [Desulfobacterales bacterium]
MGDKRWWELFQMTPLWARKKIIEEALREAAPKAVRRSSPERRRLIKTLKLKSLPEKRKYYFLDVGGWYHDRSKGFSHTDFGLVSGKYILICSWLNMEGEKRGLKYYKYCGKNKVPVNYDKKGFYYFTRSIDEFFNMPKGAIVAHFKADEAPFISDNELIMFLPDLHLHLSRETVIDNFMYNCNFKTNPGKPKLISLEGELAELLERAQSLGAEIIQVGDCFEIWEMQAHLIDDYRYLDGFIRAAKYHSPLKVLVKMWRERKIIPRDDYQYRITDLQHQCRAAEASGVEPPLSQDHVDQLGVPIDDTYTHPTAPKSQVDVIQERIMAKYPKIFDNEKLKTVDRGMPFKWLRGNHDNMRANYYYEKVEETDIKLLCSRIIKQACTPPEVLDAYDRYKGGIESCICAEHGHRFDSVNAASVFDGNNKGYDTTRFFTLGRWIGESGWHNGSIELTCAEIGENLKYYMRGEQLDLVYDIFDNDQKIRLVVMGHTHTPILVDWGIFLIEVLLRSSQYFFERSIH